MWIKSIILLSIFISLHECFLSRQKRFVYPPGSGMGIFLALAVPIDLPRKSVFVAYNFEANYVLPNNDTYEENLDQFVVEPEEERKSQSILGFNRTVAYKILESKLQSHGYPGRDCLLRTICEVSASSMEHNGLLGELLHVVLSPSTSIDEGLPSTMTQAETQGRTTGDCKSYNQNCTVSFLDLFSWMGV